MSMTFSHLKEVQWFSFLVKNQSKLLSKCEAGPGAGDQNRCGYDSFCVCGVPGAMPVIYNHLMQS